MRLVLAFVTASALTGCSWIYNPNNIDTSRIDAPSDAEIILDADPSKLTIENINPSVVDEGQGDGGSAPALVVLYGHNMVDANTTVQLSPVTPLPAGVLMPELGAPVIAKDGDWIAFPVTAHVDPALTAGMALAFTVQVTEDTLTPGMQSTATTTLMLQGLDELSSGTSLDISKLAATYSSVALPSNATFTGGDAKQRVILRATSSITVQDLSALAGSAGGCAGGAASSPGGCNGGGAGTSGGGGGGGGGCATAGDAGKGTGAGAAGPRLGDDLITSYACDGNTSGSCSPGGGGGAAFLGLPGGAGGAGGASIELTADGDVSVGAITVNGSAGGSGSAGAGGGGGGAGGLVMLRAGHMLTTAGSISVSGGAGAGTAGKDGAGGAGAGGRIRWDARIGSAPTMTAPMVGTPGSLHRGPAFALDSYIFRDPKAKITVLGTPDDRFHTYAVNYDPSGPQTIDGQNESIGPGGSVEFTQVLQQGLSHLCLTIDGGKQGTPEADKCVWVAFLP